MDVPAQEYAQGLLVEEMSEASAMLGKAMRFGIDTPGPVAEPYLGKTARQGIEIELGDVLEAIEFACLAGLVDRENLGTRAQIKLRKLLNPESRDNLGRRLAPELGVRYV